MTDLTKDRTPAELLAMADALEWFGSAGVRDLRHAIEKAQELRAQAARMEAKNISSTDLRAAYLREFLHIEQPLDEDQRACDASSSPQSLQMMADHARMLAGYRSGSMKDQRACGASSSPDSMKILANHTGVVAGYRSGVIKNQRADDSEGAMPSTPAANWRKDGKPDPHDERYSGERATLCLGYLTDDEIANLVYLQPNVANLTAAKERIRWLSRALVAASSKLDAEREVGPPSADAQKPVAWAPPEWFERPSRGQCVRELSHQSASEADAGVKRIPLYLAPPDLSARVKELERLLRVEHALTQHSNPFTCSDTGCSYYGSPATGCSCVSDKRAGHDDQVRAALAKGEA